MFKILKKLIFIFLFYCLIRLKTCLWDHTADKDRFASLCLWAVLMRTVWLDLHPVCKLISADRFEFERNLIWKLPRCTPWGGRCFSTSSVKQCIVSMSVPLLFKLCSPEKQKFPLDQAHICWLSPPSKATGKISFLWLKEICLEALGFCSINQRLNTCGLSKLGFFVLLCYQNWLGRGAVC